MTVTGQNQSARRKTCSSVIFTIKNPKYTELESNPGLGFEELATKRLTYGTGREKRRTFVVMKSATWRNMRETGRRRPTT